MSITIHYNGTLDNRARLEEMLDAARLFCAEQRWMYRDVDEQIVGEVERVLEEKSTAVSSAGFRAAKAESTTAAFPIDDTLNGILITVHPDTEPVWLTFNAASTLIYYAPLNDNVYWEIKSLYTNTSRAGVSAHIAICELLHLLQDKYFPNLHVYDESGYFESGDEQQLKMAIRSTDSRTDLFRGGIQEAEADEPTEDAASSSSSETSEADEENAVKRKKKFTPRGKQNASPNAPRQRGSGFNARKN